jgi:hypothetical protein
LLKKSVHRPVSPIPIDGDTWRPCDPPRKPD